MNGIIDSPKHSIISTDLMKIKINDVLQIKLILHINLN